VTLLTVAGLNIAQLVNGAIVVEFIYDYDGMGSYLLEAVARREFFAIQTLVAMVAVLFILANTIVDMLYTVVDPRVRAEASS
jgi:peptide/nickel transport system permease protein